MARPDSPPLRLVLRQADGSLAVTGPDASLPEVELVAYAAHGRLSGRIRLDSARLSDMLNAHESFELDQVLATELPSGHSRIIPHVTIRRDELFLVYAGGPRGDRARRRPTVARAVTMKLGPYQVTGDLHTAPGLDPLINVRKRQPMVPLTEAVVQYQTANGPVAETVDTVVVNRDLAEWVRRTEVARSAAPALRSIRGVSSTG